MNRCPFFLHAQTSPPSPPLPLSLSLHFATPCTDPSQRQPPSPVSLLFISLTPANRRPFFLHEQTTPPSPATQSPIISPSSPSTCRTHSIHRYPALPPEIAPSKEKLVVEQNKCTQEGAIQLTQEQISVNVLGGRSGYLRGFGNGPKPTSTTRSTRTDSEDGERGALRATVERLQNELGARSQEIEQMKNNQVAMQRQMEEMMQLVARVTGSDMMTQGGVLTS